MLFVKNTYDRFSADHQNTLPFQDQDTSRDNPGICIIQHRRQENLPPPLLKLRSQRFSASSDMLR